MDGGLAAVLYGPSSVTAKAGEGGKKVRIQQKTQYPFKEDIEFTIHPEDALSFPLYLRIPQWCDKPRVQVNGEVQQFDGEESGYVCIERRWQSGDRVLMKLPMVVKLKRWPRNGSASIYRGPLAYSLKIDERWQQCNEVDYQKQKGTPEWPQWEVLPGSPWNYGLVLDDAGRLIVDEVRCSKDIPLQPFDLKNVPVSIRTRGKQVPAWSLQENTAAELQNSPVLSDRAEEPIELIPLCSARLRMGCLPVIGEPPVAKAWQPVDAVIPDEEWPKNRFDEMYAIKKANIGQQ